MLLQLNAPLLFLESKIASKIHLFVILQAVQDLGAVWCQLNELIVRPGLAGTAAWVHHTCLSLGSRLSDIKAS